MCYLIANRMSKSSGSELEISFAYIDPSSEQLNILLSALRDKQWKSISFSQGSLVNIDATGTEILENVIGIQNEL